jgi:type I restriction enzyme S subunit
MSKVPPGWTRVPLSDIADVQLGKMLDQAKNLGQPVQYLRNVNVRWGQFDLADLQTMRMSNEEANFFDVRDGDVFVCEGGEPGRCAVWRHGPNDFTYQKALHRVRFNGKLAPQLLTWQLKLDATLERLSNHFTGTTIKHIPRTALLRYEVLVPPLAEQNRITDKLDTVLARVDDCRDRLARVAPLLKRFRQSVLTAATSGRLTDAWRTGEKKNWHPVSIESLCESISDGPFGSNLKSDDYTESGIRVVRLENIVHLAFDASKETYISHEKYATLSKHTLRGGDLMFSSFVDEEVRICELPANLDRAAINKADCFCLRVDPAKCLPKFLVYRLACKTTYMTLKEQVHGATRPRINLRQLRDFTISLPSPAEQIEIVRRVETLFAFADRLDARLTQARAAADRLTPALLAKAFRGELVPQDPDDEPAAELLKRLAAGTLQNSAKRTRRASTTGAAASPATAVPTPRP